MDTQQCNGENRRINILYVGDEDLVEQPRGEHLRAEARQNCWQVTVSAGAGWKAPDTGRPDVVILDNFPESGPARAAFYHFRPDKRIRFVALNRNPHDLRFIHLNSLSFMKMLQTDTAPRKILNEAARMLGTGSRRRLTTREACCPDLNLPGGRLSIPYRASCRPCC